MPWLLAYLERKISHADDFDDGDCLVDRQRKPAIHIPILTGHDGCGGAFQRRNMRSRRCKPEGENADRRRPRHRQHLIAKNREKIRADEDELGRRGRKETRVSRRPPWLHSRHQATAILLHRYCAWRGNCSGNCLRAFGPTARDLPRGPMSSSLASGAKYDPGVAGGAIRARRPPAPRQGVVFAAGLRLRRHIPHVGGLPPR